MPWYSEKIRKNNLSEWFYIYNYYLRKCKVPHTFITRTPAGRCGWGTELHAQRPDQSKGERPWQLEASPTAVIFKIKDKRQTAWPMLCSNMWGFCLCYGDTFFPWTFSVGFCICIPATSAIIAEECRMVRVGHSLCSYVQDPMLVIQSLLIHWICPFHKLAAFLSSTDQVST